jgi:hypothetical protein
LKIRHVVSKSQGKTLRLRQRLERIDLVHAGRDTYPLGERIRAVSTYRIWTDVEPL